MVEPGKRLGAGEPGSETDMAALARHPFFKDLSLDQLFTGRSPFPVEFEELDLPNPGSLTLMPQVSVME